MTIVLLFAAHQGEEFVVILPAIMLLGAFFIMRWANQPADEQSGSDKEKADSVVDEPEPIDEPEPDEDREPVEIH